MEPIAPIDLSIGRPGTTTRQIKYKENNQLLEERLEKLESNHKMKERDGKMLEIKLAQEIIDLKEGLSYVVSEVANAHQRIDDHEKEMKQLDLQRQFLWAQVDELRVQMVPLEKTENNRTMIPIPGSVRALCSILEKGRRALIPNPGKENEQTSICEKDGAQLPNPGKDQVSTQANNSAQIPNPGNESEQATYEKDSVQIANPNNEKDQNEQAQMVTCGIERVWIPIAENEPDPLLNNTNTINTEDSLITTERADMAVKAIDDVHQIEISCTNSMKEKQRPVSSDSNEESIPTTENLLTIFPDSGTENGNHDMISALDISDSQMKIKNNLPVPGRRGRRKTTHEISNPLKRPIRKSKKGSPSDNPSKELWKCNFCQKGFTSPGRYRNNHELRCPSRNRSNPKAVSADPCVKSAQVKSLEHGRTKRQGENPFKCDVCGMKFKKKHTLRRHMLNHNPQNWKQCHDCDYRTPRDDTLTIHIRSKHTV